MHESISKQVQWKATAKLITDQLIVVCWFFIKQEWHHTATRHISQSIAWEEPKSPIQCKIAQSMTLNSHCGEKENLTKKRRMEKRTVNLQSMQACIINEPILTLQWKGNSQTKNQRTKSKQWTYRKAGDIRNSCIY